MEPVRAVFVVSTKKRDFDINKLVVAFENERRAYIHAARENMIEWINLWTHHRDDWWAYESDARKKHLTGDLLTLVSSFFEDDDEKDSRKRRRLLATRVSAGVNIDLENLSLPDLKALNEYLVESVHESEIEDIGEIIYVVEKLNVF